MNPSFHAFAVHTPIGISLVLPIVIALLAFFVLRRRTDKRVWWIVVFLATAVTVGAFVASSSGEVERESLRPGVEVRALDAHESAGDRLVLASCALTALALVAGLQKNEARHPIFYGASFLLSLLVAAAALNAGMLGGELVYRHHAATYRSDSAR